VERTINGIPSRRLVYVENYQVQREIDVIQEQFDLRLKDIQAVLDDKLDELDEAISLASTANPVGEVFTSANAFDVEDETIDSVGIAGVIVGSVAVLLGLLNVAMIRKVDSAKASGSDSNFKSDLQFES